MDFSHGASALPVHLESGYCEGEQHQEDAQSLEAVKTHLINYYKLFPSHNGC